MNITIKTPHKKTRSYPYHKKLKSFFNFLACSQISLQSIALINPSLFQDNVFTPLKRFRYSPSFEQILPGTKHFSTLRRPQNKIKTKSFVLEEILKFGQNRGDDDDMGNSGTEFGLLSTRMQPTPSGCKETRRKHAPRHAICCLSIYCFWLQYRYKL